MIDAFLCLICDVNDGLIFPVYKVHPFGPLVMPPSLCCLGPKMSPQELRGHQVETQDGFLMKINAAKGCF